MWHHKNNLYGQERETIVAYLKINVVTLLEREKGKD